MGFIDEVMKARESDLRDEIGASRVVSGAFQNAAEKLKSKIVELKKLEKMGTYKGTAATRKLTESIMHSVETLADEAANQAGSAIDKMRERVITKTLSNTSFLTAEEAGKQAALETTFSQVPITAVHEMATRPLIGVTPGKAAQRISERMKMDLKKTLSTGLITGAPISEISKDIEKISGMAQSAATRLTRTNLAAASNDALRATYEANSDVLDGYTWDATLDERVCAICGALHGTFFSLGSSPPGPPRHPNCRCTLTPHLRDEDVDEEEYKRVRPLREDGMRSSKTELVKADKKFESWLKDQPEGTTERVTGSPIKDKLWRDGKVPFTDLVQADNGILSDEQVVKRALALKPNDPVLKKLANELNIKQIKASSVQAARAAELRNAAKTHSLGTRPGLEARTNELRAKLDAKKKSVLAKRDSVQGAVKQIPENKAAVDLNQVCHSPCKVKSPSVPFPDKTQLNELETAANNVNPDKLESKALGKLKAGSYGINSEIISGDMSGVTKKRIARLDGLFEKAPVTTSDFRMTAVFQPGEIPSVGKEFVYKGFTQGSLSPVGDDALQQLAAKSKGKLVRAQVRVPSGTKGVYSGGPLKDFTIPRNARFHVVANDGAGITLEVLDTGAKTSLKPFTSPVMQPAVKKSVTKAESLTSKSSTAVKSNELPHASDAQIEEMGKTSKLLKYDASKDEYDAFHNYAAGSGDLNAELRSSAGALTPYNKKAVQYMDDVFEKAPVLPGEIKVYRFMDKDDLEYIASPGSTFVDKGYVSTTATETGRKTTKEQFLDSFAGNEIAEVEIRLPFGTKGIYLGQKNGLGNKNFRDQMEVLLPRGSKFKVISKTGNSAVLEVIPGSTTARAADVVSKAVDNKSLGFVDFAGPKQHKDIVNDIKSLGANGPKAEIHAFQEYSGSSFVNRSLRQGTSMTPNEISQVGHMDAVFKKVAPLKQPVKVVRFMTGGENIARKVLPEVGGVFTDKGFASTTFSRKGEEYVEKSFTGYKLEIRLPKGARGVYMNAGHSPFGSRHFIEEDEFLLPRNTRYRVISKERGGAVLEVVL